MNETTAWSSYLRLKVNCLMLEFRNANIRYHWEHNQYLLDISMNQSYPITKDILLSISISINTQHVLVQSTWERLGSKDQNRKKRKTKHNNVKPKSISIEVNWFSEWNWNRLFDETSRWLKTSHDHPESRLLIVRMCEFKH